MYTVEDIIEQAHRLSPKDRRRLIDELKHSLVEEPAEEQFLPEGPYARSLALAGTAHTDFTDVSADKYRHLAEAYAVTNRR
jgi:hypothetical protein